ncbi:T9SS C-terminal target domain-containing protein [Rhodohalobacter sp. SW132]|uniref:SMP-30/gluconolactonase/LRE family protein n=1 Tax=Rhodohalobacter sp. SW132 TaxID=2293433 RepID=UPI000E2576BD|nr:SMP-30/gluconolactonase/LRE family protein [Rhodohalobacter sp. SW132]REL37955.1 T9SS C-terminal target domain-containing protein [Rhodohalobacter sp. SW132]
MIIFNRCCFSFKKALFTLAVLVLFINLSFAQSPVPEDVEVEHLADGFTLSEGPFWHPDGYLIFSDVSESIIYKWTESGGVEPFLEPSGEANGITSDLFGNLVIAQHDARQVGRLESDLETITPLATEYNGNRLHSPNDLVVKSDGAIFFTDPPWGGNESEIDFHGVYRIPPDGGPIQLLVDDLDYPNGLAFSPDESKLYISETLNSYIHVYDVVDDSTLANGSVFAIANQHGDNPQSGADGIKVDNDGNVWAVGSDGVAIFSPNGDLLDIIPVPESTTNLNWGGTDRLKLFITNFSDLYKVDLGPLERPDAPVNLVAMDSENGVSLQWEGTGESIRHFTVYRSADGEPFEKIIAAPFNNFVTDTDVQSNAAYTYKVTVTDIMGFESGFSNEAGAMSTGLDESQYQIDSHKLQQNYPNPFNPSTNITFSLENSGRAALNVYNLNGRLIDSIFEGTKSAGFHEVVWDASRFPSGLYIYTLKTERDSHSRKMLLIK